MHFGLAELVNQYGYLALFLGALVEGETIVVLAGFAAHRGLLSLPMVMLLAGIGAFLGDQAFFWLGRYRRDWLLARMPRLAKNLEFVSGKIAGREPFAIISSRFIYGMRTTSAVAFGTTHYDGAKYSLFNLIGAVVWAVSISLAGYFFGTVAEKILADAKRYEELLLLVIIVIGLALAFRHWLRGRRE
jgi:membrane protein DedA with SNARE-associated domain